jgi:uncharacterized protein (DUF2164 family)
MKPDENFHFSKEQLEELRASLKAYFLDELDMEVGDLQVDLFIDFFNQNIGKQYYNLGVTETIQAIKEKADDLMLLVRD